MLYEISEGVSAKNAVILLHPGDNVVVARVAISAEQSIEVGSVNVIAKGFIPPGHKLALRPIAVGEPVYRYGNLIGFATQAIEPGEHVHEHNLGYQEVQTSAETPIAPAPRFDGPVYA